MKEIRKIIELYDDFAQEGTACGLATVVNIEASSYRRIGARMLVGTDGRFTGGISGGCLEGDALRRARAAIYQGKPSIQYYDTLEGEDEVIGIGLGCNGRIGVVFTPIDAEDHHHPIRSLRSILDTRKTEILCQYIAGPAFSRLAGRLFTAANWQELGIDSLELHRAAEASLQRRRSIVTTLADQNGESAELLFEAVRPTLHLVVIGDGYDVSPLLHQANLLGWRTTQIGRERKLTAEIRAAANRTLDVSAIDQVHVDKATAVVLMSHDYRLDEKMLRHFQVSTPAYLGVLGPRKRLEKLNKENPDLGLLEQTKLFGPVGLDIGAENPEEIAVAVVAEILSVFRDRAGGFLRERPGTIHARTSASA